MSQSPLHPFHEEAVQLQRHCKLGLHTGTARVGRISHNDNVLLNWFRQLRGNAGLPEEESAERTFGAGFVVPASGNALLFLNSSTAETLPRDFGADLTMQGDSPDGPFTLHCPQFYVHARSDRRQQRGWAVATPVNETLVISYGQPRPIARVEAVINNFDFESGNGPIELAAGHSKVLRVEAAGRTVEFAWRQGHDHLKTLVEAGVYLSPALTTFSFPAWEDASDDELFDFALSVAWLCAVVVRQHTGVPVLAFLDEHDRVVKRLIGNPVESNYRGDSILPHMQVEHGMPKLFRDCFEEHVRLRRSPLWSRLCVLIACIEDPPYVEQKHATLMAAIELLIRNSLVEGKHLTAEAAERKTLNELIGAARIALRWDVPKHYTAGDRHRDLRNAVAHGGDLPYDPTTVRRDFDKWYLFLLRRFLMRLGFNGPVACPQRGFAAMSRVDEFGEEHNAFGA